MKRVHISHVETVILIMQDKICRSYEARYDNRLQAVLMVAKGKLSQGGRIIGRYTPHSCLLGEAIRYARAFRFGRC